MRHMLAAVAVLAMAAGLPASAQEQAPDAALTPAVIEPLAVRSLMLDLARAGGRIVAVGERGNVLYSLDEGRSWTQVQVPVSANLTAVYFVDERHGWAVGHDDVILRTEDAGDSWELVNFAPENNRPLLDVWFADENRGYAVGAYGAIYASEDGGRSWKPVPFEPAPLGGESAPPDPDDYYAEVDMGFDFHLNAIAPADDGALYLAAEAGRLFRSDDSGASWRELPSPYDGSFYGILPLDGSALLAFGLRGHVFHSGDGGQTWSEPIPTGTTALLNSAIRPSSDLVIVAGLNGVMLVSRDGGRSFGFTQQDDRKSLAAVMWAGDGEAIVAGETGLRRLAVPGLR